MPELAEVGRIVHFIRQHLVGKTLSKVQANHDEIIYGKVGTSAAEFQKAMQGKKVTGAGQQGKYFWMTMSTPPHAVMHFGMAGWMKIKDQDTYYYRSDKPGDQEWPPKYAKFILETSEDPQTEAAFVDPRRLSRIRLVDCPAEEIRNHTPLKENGPDPVADKDIVNEAWLRDKLRAKKVPVKALLLDQANISGIGNWLGDEILYHARIHPEQYSNTLSDEQIKELHNSLHYVCSTAMDALADSEKFPEHWLFKHRWGKGKKDHPKALPNGDKITFITVGGRTSAVVLAVQKKAGAVATENGDGGESAKPKRKKPVKEEEDEPSDLDEEPAPKVLKSKGRGKSSIKKEAKDDDAVKEELPQDASPPRRRSTRSRK
ncbi:Uncharacterized protein PECH_000694 [Penicillium ucsense]|uniref:Formamidopyrimidine-DNA glycosylase catalytic domain-containing protein n=1 Tax=Penicillium ucsense TaxID=2839758 RepID=A0A8J8W7X6_9EURO|nr:Uncharacterized protein PECM_004955 [Penicillium ucsense]KAF7738419.1 Uncharacterized protein PECH_000694 [Penicillium ucsense]